MKPIMAKIDGNMTRELDDNLLDILTADQRAGLEKMKGAKADIGSSSSKWKAAAKTFKAGRVEAAEEINYMDALSTRIQNKRL